MLKRDSCEWSVPDGDLASGMGRSVAGIGISCTACRETDIYIQTLYKDAEAPSIFNEIHGAPLLLSWYSGDLTFTTPQRFHRSWQQQLSEPIRSNIKISIVLYPMQMPGERLLAMIRIPQIINILRPYSKTILYRRRRVCLPALNP